MGASIGRYGITLKAIFSQATDGYYLETMKQHASGGVRNEQPHSETGYRSWPYLQLLEDCRDSYYRYVGYVNKEE
jgi:hypothetical protein